MMKIFEPKVLDIHDLDLEDRRFRISEFPVLDPLILSIRKIGLLHPPIVTVRGGRFVLVSGWKRVSACLKLRILRLPVFILDEADDLKAFMFALYENLGVREFSLLEKAEILSRLQAFGLPKSRTMTEVMPLLHIPPTAIYREGYLTIATLQPLVKKMIAEKSLPFSLAQMFAEFTAHDLKDMMPLLLPLGQNKQKEVLEDLLEISRRRRISPGRILRGPEIQAILRSKKWPAVQKSERVRFALRRERFPHLSAWGERFQSALKELHWPKGIAVETAPYFETDVMEAAFRFKDEKEFKARLRDLLDVSSRKEFPRLFRRPRQPSRSRKKPK
jgi:ParB family chromosome partitioning protein